MAAKVVVEGSSRVTASQLSDLFRQIGDGSLRGFHIQALLDHRDPFADTPIDWERAYAELGITATASLPTSRWLM